jgi:hypothetical protein
MRGSARRSRGRCAYFDAQRFADEPFEFGRMSRRGPQLELGVAGRPQLQ